MSILVLATEKPPREVFRFMALHLDIDLIREHLAAGDVTYETAEVNIVSWAEGFLGLHRSRPSKQPMGLIRVNPDFRHISEDRLKDPIFVVQVPKTGGMIVDGNHRVAKAYLSGRDTLPALVFPETEFKKLQAPVKRRKSS